MPTAQQRLFFGNRRETVFAALLGALLLAAFAPTLVEMAREWFKHPEYGHGVLMPPVAAWVLWERRKKLAAMVRSGGGASLMITSMLALAPLGVLLLLGEMKLSWFLKPFSFVVSLAAVIALLWGWKGFKALATPLVILCLMCPIPWRILLWLTMPLKRHASVLATGLMDLTGLEASLQGNLIHVPGISALWIADQCSGVRSLISLMSVAVLGCLFWKRHWILKVVVVVSCAPIAVAVNGIRIWATAMLAKYVSPAAAEGFFHVFEGFVLFLVAALVLLGWTRVLNRMVPKKDDAEEPVDAGSEADARPDRPVLRAVSVALASLLLAITVLGVYRLRDRLNDAGADEAAVAHMQASFSQLPMELASGAYLGEPILWDAASVKASGADAYGSAVYKDAKGRAYQVYIGGAMRNAENFHSPNVCMPSAGWEMLDAEVAPLEVYATANDTPKMHRLVLQMGESRMLAYYWFQAGDRLADGEWAVRFYRLLDLLRGDPLSPTMIVSIYVPIEENVESTDAAAHLFLAAIASHLREVTTTGGIHG